MTKNKIPRTPLRLERTAFQNARASKEADQWPNERDETPWADTRYEAGTCVFRDPVTGAETKRPITVEYPERYFPTCEDLRRLVHAVLRGEFFESHHQEDYEYATEVSHKARANDPADRDWLRARIGVERAKGVDPAVRFGTEIELDPSLDRRATLAKGWPKRWDEFDYADGIVLTDSQLLYSVLMGHFGATYHLGAVNNGPLRPKDQRCGEEMVRRSIRLIVCLYGQQGLDEILKEGEVQEVLGSTPLREFSATGLFPNLRLS